MKPSSGVLRLRSSRGMQRSVNLALQPTTLGCANSPFQHLYHSTLYMHRGRRVIGISGSLIWSKTLMELIFNPCGEFWWSPEGTISHNHSPHRPPVIFSDLLRSVKMLKRERERGVRRATGSYRTYSSLVKLQPGFLGLQWKTCL